MHGNLPFTVRDKELQVRCGELPVIERRKATGLSIFTSGQQIVFGNTEDVGERSHGCLEGRHTAPFPVPHAQLGHS